MLWKVVRSPILEMREIVGCSQSEFASFFGIPLKTLQNWEQLQRVPPVYIISMMHYVLVHEYPDSDFSDVLHSDFDLTNRFKVEPKRISVGTQGGNCFRTTLNTSKET